MIIMAIVPLDAFTHWVSTLRGRLHASFYQCEGRAWLRCNSLQWNNHSASLRLALHPFAVMRIGAHSTPSN